MWEVVIYGDKIIVHTGSKHFVTKMREFAIMQGIACSGVRMVDPA
jgi:DNA polymerase/3'-5' exonuclease PolX